MSHITILNSIYSFMQFIVGFCNEFGKRGVWVMKHTTPIEKKSIKVSDMMINFPYLVIKACSRMNEKSGETYKYFKARYLEC